jgi:anti-sigma regulatory factor (Ser/Thr protein kinase)
LVPVANVADHPAPLELRLAAVPPSVTEARAAAAGYAGDAGADAADVELAVAEAVANAVLHAFPDRTPGTVTVMAAVTRDSLIIQVNDDGSGMRPNPDGGGLGLGLALIGRLTESFSVSDVPSGGTSLRMSFQIGSGGPSLV